MATFLYSPMSPPETGTNFSFVEGTSVCDFMHVSDTVEVKDNKTNQEQDRDSDSQTTCTPHMCSYYQPTQLQSPSEPSTAKIQLQQSNRRLLELLESVQAELDKQRALMRDIQNRVSTLEHESESNAVTRVQSSATSVTSSSQTHIKAAPKCTSNLPMESRAWWEACQTFAHNCSTPFNATEFLVTPHQPQPQQSIASPQQPQQQQQLSALNFDFAFENNPNNNTDDDAQTFVARPTASEILLTEDFNNAVPKLAHVPSPTAPESGIDTTPTTIIRSITIETQTHVAPIAPSPPAPTTTTTITAQSSTPEPPILERVLDLSHAKIRAPPLLQSPPRSLKNKASVVTTLEQYEELDDCYEDSDITALPEIPALTSPVPSVQSLKKAGLGVGGGHWKMKSLCMVRTLLKGKAGERGEEECGGSKRVYVHR
ncbi:hypothetical protein IAQ61_010700 [Plenodomus lingam]|uniref:uncharacterized protein n=1 Tax=Leptosphaeria maculans TaxID=5022 RepID=UPI00331B9379|nr:hypothetical protein IAQ61_010700 [Plenodomus lingam]